MSGVPGEGIAGIDFEDSLKPRPDQTNVSGKSYSLLFWSHRDRAHIVETTNGNARI